MNCYGTKFWRPREALSKQSLILQITTVDTSKKAPSNGGDMWFGCVCDERRRWTVTLDSPFDSRETLRWNIQISVVSMMQHAQSVTVVIVAIAKWYDHAYRVVCSSPSSTLYLIAERYLCKIDILSFLRSQNIVWGRWDLREKYKIYATWALAHGFSSALVDVTEHSEHNSLTSLGSPFRFRISTAK